MRRIQLLLRVVFLGLLGMIALAEGCYRPSFLPEQPPLATLPGLATQSQRPPNRPCVHAGKPGISPFHVSLRNLLFQSSGDPRRSFRMPVRRTNLIALLLATLLFGMLAGCRSDPSVKLLEGELRWMEDQYYALEEQYQRKCRELESCRLAHQARESSSANADERDTARPPSSRRGRDDDNETTPLQVPRVEGLPDLRSSGNSDMPSVLELPEPDGTGVRPSSYFQLVETDVTHILLNRQLTGGYDRDGLPGDDGVMIVIEPRNSAGQFVPMPGETIIELRDPDQATPEKQTIARWKLTPQQAHAKMRRSLLGRGVHLELAWPNEPPPSGEYEVAVTYNTSNEQLTATRAVHIDPPRDPSLRWTPVSDPIVTQQEPFDASEGFIVQEHPGNAVGNSPPPATLPAPVRQYEELRTAPLPQNSSIDAPSNRAPGR